MGNILPLSHWLADEMTRQQESPLCAFLTAVEGGGAAEANGATDLLLWQADHSLHDLRHILPHQLAALL